MFPSLKRSTRSIPSTLYKQTLQSIHSPPTRIRPSRPFFPSSRSTTTPRPTSYSLSRPLLRAYTTTSTNSSVLPPPLSPYQKLRALFRTHGWSALSIYLLLSLLDFSLTFLLIYAVGADKVRIAEDWVLDTLGWRRALENGEGGGKMRRRVEEWKVAHSHGGAGAGVGAKMEERKVEVPSEGEKEKEKEKGLVKVEKKGGGGGYSTIATTAVLAYAIHKTLLLPVRIGLTLAITPRAVRLLQSWGWKVGLTGVASTGAKQVGEVVTRQSKP